MNKNKIYKFAENSFLKRQILLCIFAKVLASFPELFVFCYLSEFENIRVRARYQISILTSIEFMEIKSKIFDSLFTLNLIRLWYYNNYQVREAYLGSCVTSVVEIFCKNSQRLSSCYSGNIYLFKVNYKNTRERC